MPSANYSSETQNPLWDFVLHHLKVKVNVCTYSPRTNGYELPVRTVRDWNLIYNCQGRLVWVIEGREHSMAEGDLVVVPPHIEHHAFSLTKKAAILSLHLQPMLPDGQDAFALLPPPRFLSISSGSRLDDYFKGAAREWQRFDRSSNALCRLYQAGWARLIVLELLREHCRSGHYQQTVDPLILKILKLLEDHICETLTLGQLSQRVGYSAQHINRLFRSALGITPLQYHRRMKMEKAADLLIHSPLSVQGVGLEVGIDDPAYFSRLFHQHMGQSPVAYRSTSQAELQDQV